MGKLSLKVRRIVSQWFEAHYGTDPAEGSIQNNRLDRGGYDK